MRNEVNPENTFVEFLNKVKKTLSEALDNEVYPFDKLVDELDVERVQNRNPLFDVMAAWMIKNGMEMKFNFGDIEVEGLDFNITKSMFDLSFLFAETDGKVAFAIEYNTSLFKRERIERMSEHFKILIENIAANPHGQIKNLEILPTFEKKKLLFEFNNTNHSHSIEKNVIDLFINQAEVNKNNIVLVYNDRKLSYDELNKLSNRISNSIIESTKPNKDEIIPVVVNDPVLAAASMLAVMKTGAAYLPIMTSDPAERISFIIKNCNARIVLTDNNLSIGKNGADGNVRFINVEENLSEDVSSPNVKIDGDSLAYVIYTSGSTGLPKGVLIEHESLSNLISSLNENVYSQYENPLNELMITSFAFDVSIKQIFATLCNGNTLHILNKEKKLDPREIVKYIISHNINIVDLTPSVLSVMIEEGFAEINKPYLKEIFLGSEALPFKLIKNFYNVESNKKIHITNFYGPTECCVESSYFKITNDILNENYDITPIGKAALNQQIYILDKYSNLCPIGVPGEICIAGKGLARQYLNDIERTNEKFISLPWLNETRIYKTGDLGRVDSDGNIEFIGRTDDQVKVRGFRIELQEIEKRLLELEEIKECAVILFEKNGTKELTAYYTSNEVIDEASLKKHLEHFLPKYMIPSCFIRLEKIPLSANGKTNKKLLPDPGGYKKKEKAREPQDDVELIIIRICSEVLKKEGLTLDDNFFEIGGHSLNAVRLISRIQKELNVEIPLKEIFFNPVLFDIAAIVKKFIEESHDVPGKSEVENTVVPISEEELKMLSNLNFDDEE